MIDFCYDDLGENPDLGYPNLARPGLDPDQFDITWPRCVPLRLLMYLKQFGLRFQAHLIDLAPRGSWYPIALAWHDFDCDYFDLMSKAALQRLRRGEIKVLFYYHEGDHPGRIKQRLDHLCLKHRIARDCYLFVSANSSARLYSNFHYFADHEYFLAYINRRQHAMPANAEPRAYEFTALNRTHKWWRASVMSDLHDLRVLDRSLWSYNTTLTEDDSPEDNPIRIDALPGWSDIMERFLSRGPYVCDTDDTTSQNDHRSINASLYTQGYCGLIVETLFDADQSGGSFLTEKTYKCMKFGQPFVIAGPVGSLEVLRESGYRVFDHAIDNVYDKIVDNTDRWLSVRQSILDIQAQDMHRWYLSCLDDVRHNQWNFSTKSHAALDRLAAKLAANSDTV